MKNNQYISITYGAYWSNGEKNRRLMPLCLKLWNQRWYVVGRSADSRTTHIYSLDRIESLRIETATFEYPEDF